MQKKRLTIQEVNDFKPTYFNPLVVECDDARFSDELSRIRIISPVNNGFVGVVCNYGKAFNLPIRFLHHYPSQNQPEEVMVDKKTVEKTLARYYRDDGYVLHEALHDLGFSQE